ncbi:MAG: rRNA maturation RNase YbeY [Rikenellaceae bacterium]
MSVKISNLDVNLRFNNKRVISACVKQMIADKCEKKLGDISVVFCSDEQILETNNTYLNHNYYTDIITFDYCDDTHISGDLLISIDTVKLNAKDYGVTFLNELHRVILHGVLHLLGQKDKSDKDFKKMKQLEDQYLLLLSQLLSAKNEI